MNTFKHQDSVKIGEIYNKFEFKYHKSRKSGKGRLFNELLDMPVTLSLLPEDLNAKSVLDAGCGSGIYAQALARRHAKVMGVDASETMITIAKNETPADLEIEYLIGDLYELPFKERTFDYIICTYVLENIENIEKVLNGFYSILKDDGICIISISHPIRAQAKPVKENNRDYQDLWYTTASV